MSHEDENMKKDSEENLEENKIEENSEKTEEEKTPSEELQEELDQTEEVSEDEQLDEEDKKAIKEGKLKMPQDKSFFMYVSIALGILLIMSIFTGGFSDINIEMPTGGDGETSLSGPDDSDIDPLDEFAQCLTENNAVLYGTGWCGFSNQQKDMFGDSFEYLDYVDCEENSAVCSAAGVTGYPTWIIDGESVSGVQSFENLAQRTGCEFEGAGEPEETVDVDEPEVNLLVLSDSRCDDCEMMSQELIGQMNTLFPNLNLEVYDYDTEEGKAFYEDLDFTYLPLFLFDETVKDSQGYGEISQFMDEGNDYESLRIGASFDPTKEICDDGIDNTGNGLIDCEDPDCKNTLTCNPDLFVECAADFDVSSDAVVFYYSDTCPWCTLMKPAIEQLQGEGYNIVMSDSTSAEDNVMINECFGEYMGGGVPQFVCLKNNEVRSGAFADQDMEADVDAMRDWIDNCQA